MTVVVVKGLTSGAGAGGERVGGGPGRAARVAGLKSIGRRISGDPPPVLWKFPYDRARTTVGLSNPPAEPPVQTPWSQTTGTSHRLRVSLDSKTSEKFRQGNKPSTTLEDNT